MGQISVLEALTTSAVIEIIKKIIEWFRGRKRHKKVFYPKGQEQLKKVIRRINSPELKDNPIVVEFKGNYNIVNIGGNYGIVPKKASDTDIVKTLKEVKEKEATEEINLLPIERAEDFVEYRTSPKYINREISDIFENLSLRLKSLVGLSIQIERYYKSKKKGKAEELKLAVRDRYGDTGLKIANLWSQSYLKSLFHFLSKSQVLPLDLNNKIQEFIEKAESIFFVHSWSDEGKITANINRSLRTGKDYVAVHGLGLGGVQAHSSAMSIKRPKGYDYEIVEIAKGEKGKGSYSKIWFKGEGLRTYLLIKDVIA